MHVCFIFYLQLYINNAAATACHNYVIVAVLQLKTTKTVVKTTIAPFDVLSDDR